MTRSRASSRSKRTNRKAASGSKRRAEPNNDSPLIAQDPKASFPSVFKMIHHAASVVMTVPALLLRNTTYGRHVRFSAFSTWRYDFGEKDTQWSAAFKAIVILDENLHFYVIAGNHRVYAMKGMYGDVVCSLIKVKGTLNPEFGQRVADVIAELEASDSTPTLPHMICELRHGLENVANQYTPPKTLDTSSMINKSMPWWSLVTYMQTNHGVVISGDNNHHVRLFYKDAFELTQEQWDLKLKAVEQGRLKSVAETAPFLKGKDPFAKLWNQEISLTSMLRKYRIMFRFAKHEELTAAISSHPELKNKEWEKALNRFNTVSDKELNTWAEWVIQQFHEDRAKFYGNTEVFNDKFIKSLSTTETGTAPKPTKRDLRTRVNDLEKRLRKYKKMAKDLGASNVSDDSSAE